MLVPEDSPLRRPPSNLSRKQILILDGIRYAAEIADVAYERLYDKLQEISISRAEPSTRDIAIAIADAWAVVDSVHRFYDLVDHMPGLRKGIWHRLLGSRVADVLELRNSIQHQIGEIANLITSGGQIWGYLSWAEFVDGRYSGKWLMLSPGAEYAGDQWFFIGPNRLPFPVPRGRIRLHAFGREVYLGRTVVAVHRAVRELTSELANGNVRPLDVPATNRRGADMILEGWLEVWFSNETTSNNPPTQNRTAENS